MVERTIRFSRRAVMLAPLGLAAGATNARAGSEPDVVVAMTGKHVFDRSDFGTVGVFDVDWLTQPEFSRLLDNLAASPGAFHGGRFFGALTAGTLEIFIPESGGSVWIDPNSPPDFSATFRAFEALTARRLTPFVSLSFFPPAVSPSPIAPPQGWERWTQLVTAFFRALAADARFGAEAIASWRFEVWNEPDEGRFWSGTIDQYFDLYRATSEAIDATGLKITLGGPAIAYKPEAVPEDGPPWFDRFLRFLSASPGVRCDFLSLHRKGTVTDAPPDPRLLAQAAEATARQALAIDRARFAGITIINDEADEKVGFQVPYAPRMDERNPAWLAASTAIHAALDDEFRDDGIRFAAFADNADLQLVQAPFDGRRSIMTRATTTSTTDLLKIPAYGFYELLRFLGDRRATPVSGDALFFPTTDLYHLATYSDHAFAALITYYPNPDAVAETERRIDYEVTNIPWDNVNIAFFQIDERLSNAYAAAGGSASNPFPVPDPARLPAIRLAQEIALARPIARNVATAGGVYRETLALKPFTTLCLWLTPYATDPPAPPVWLDVTEDNGDAILRWKPNAEPFFHNYELFVIDGGDPQMRISPDPLRAALWVDANPPPGRRYGLRAVSASGVGSEIVFRD